MIFDVGLSFEAAEKASQIPPIPEGEYTLQVANIEGRESGPDSQHPGRPYLSFMFDVVQSEEFNGRKVFQNASLGFITPEGEKITTGLGFLYDIAQGLGEPWEGEDLNTEDYVGKTCEVLIVNEVDRNGKAQPKIKRFL